MDTFSGSLLDYLPKLEEMKSQILAEISDYDNSALFFKKFPEKVTPVLEGYWEVDIDTLETNYSDSWVQLSGHNPEEVKDSIAFAKSVILPEDYERISKKFHDFVTGNGIFNTHYRLKHKDGTLRWIAIRGALLKHKNGKPFRVLGVNIDITRSIAEKQVLFDSERKYRAIFENSQVAIFRTTLQEGYFLEANSKTWELLETEPAAEVSVLDFYANPEQRDELIELLRKNNSVSKWTIKIITAKGNEKWVSCSVVLNREEGILECVAQDITEMKERVQELERLNFELDSFVYHASHDLRSPLKSILGLVNLLKQDKDEEFQQNSINMIQTSIGKLDNLVEDLLSISRNKRVELRVEPFNFLNEIQSSIDTFSYSENCKGLMIRVKVNQNVPYASDLSRVRIVLNNLISNAIKYRSFVREESFLDIHVEVNKNEATLRMEDNGEGIPAHMVDKVFNMFVRASEKSSGSGLGLYIVKNIVEKLSGKIDLQSQVGVGTTFKIVLPNLDSSEPDSVD